MRAALHKLVCEPSGQQHSGDAADQLGGRHDGAGCGNLHAFVLGQECRSPVKNRETDDINAEIGHGQNPDKRVGEDHPVDERFEGLSGHIVSERSVRGFLLRLLVLVHILDFRKPDGRRGVL